MPASRKGSFFNRIKLSLRTKWKAAVNHGIWTIMCHGKLHNLANWPAEFGKIFRGILGASDKSAVVDMPV